MLLHAIMYFCLQQDKVKFKNGGEGLKISKERQLNLPKNHFCLMCSKVFTAAQSLRRHMQLHTGQYRYQCLECRKGFNEKTNYDSHMRGHEGILFQCKHCSKTFKEKKSLQSHLSIHTGQYKFTCENCQKGFNGRNRYELNLQAHQ